MKTAVIVLLIGMWVAMSAAEEITAREISKEQIKRLGEQVQDIKKDVLDISTGLIQLEEKSIYPLNTRISIFLTVAQGDKSRLDTVRVKIDAKEAVNHVYTAKEVDALQRGGVQRIYTGNLQNGEHLLEVALTGKSTSSNAYQKNANYKFVKDAGNKIIEITLAGSGSGNQGISFRD